MSERRSSPSVVIIVASVLPTLVAAPVLNSLIEGLAWWRDGVIVALALVLVTAMARRRRTSTRLLALAGSLVVFSSVLSVVDGFPFYSWLDPGGALGDGFAVVNLNPAPLPDTASLRLVVALALAWVAAIAIALATLVRVPAVAAAPAPIILVLPGLIIGASSSVTLVVASALSFLLLLWLSARPSPRPLPALIVGAASVVLSLVVPSVLPVSATSLWNFNSAIQAPISAGTPGTLIRLGDDLRRPAQVQVFTYASRNADEQYLKLADLDDFTGGEWSPTLDDASDDTVATRDQGVIGINPSVASEDDVQVKVTGLSSTWLPVPAGASQVTSSGSSGLDLSSWRWLGATNTIRTAGPVTSRGDEYTARGDSIWAGSALDALSASGMLSDIGGAAWTAPSAAELTRDLEVPTTLPPSIRKTALRIAGDGTNAYERGRLLQEWFRSDQFVYSETAPVQQGYDGDSMDVIATFLKVRKGYCVHFASAMAVMARALGIPSRIAVGYEPGEALGDGRYSVTNHALHSWPELYIDGIGWVAYEPTPTSGERSADADATPAPEPTASATPTPTATAKPSSTPKATQSAEPSAPATSSATPTAASGSFSGRSYAFPTATLVSALGVLLLVLLLAALPALVRAGRRRARIRRVTLGDRPAAAAWRELLDDVADHGLAPGSPTAGDPAAAAQTARAVLARLAGVLPADALAPATRIVDALDRERYAPPGTPSPAGLAAALLADLATARAALDAASARPARFRARWLPASFAAAATRW